MQRRTERCEGTASALLAWYDTHRRDLPWRALPGQRPDPYAVWLSEIMLQQTTVAAVRPYYRRFLALWPDVAALARASIDDVMREWAGLGYYSRARNLHACALQVAGTYRGRFPDTEAALRALPGIGSYTAAAMLAIAFGRRAVVVDANVERVVARLLAIEVPLPAARPAIHAGAAGMTPQARPGDFAQAMMDLGSTVCTPRRPLCSLCPLAADCRACTAGSPERLPVKPPKRPRPLQHRAIFFVVRRDGYLLVGTRPPRGLLGGMTELPGSVASPAFASEAALRQAPLAAAFVPVPGAVEHVFTHVTWHLHVFSAGVPGGTPAPPPWRWLALDRLAAEAFPTAMLKVFDHVRTAARPVGSVDPQLFGSIGASASQLLWSVGASASR